MRKIARLDWLIGALLVVVVLLGALIGYLAWYRPAPLPIVNSSPLVEATPVYIGQTAQAGVNLAQDRARIWQADAQLLRVSATWPEGIELEKMLSGREGWSYTYYSPTARTTAVVTVADDAVNFIPGREIDATVNPLDAASWLIDSNIAASIFFGNGGLDLAQEIADPTLIMNLSFITDETQAEWLISLFSEQRGTTFSMRVDANTGDIVDIVQGP